MAQQLYEGKQVRVGIAPETTFGTRIVDGGTFTQIMTEPADVDLDVKTDTIPLGGGNRAPLVDSLLTYAEGSQPSITINGPLSVYEADLVFASALQAVTEVDSTVHLKTFTIPTNMPDWTTAVLGTGAFACTVIKRFPEASTSTALTSAVVKSFKVTAERGTYVKLQSVWQSVFPADLDSNPSGTWELGLDGPGGASAAATRWGMKFFSGAGNYGIGTAHVAIAGAAASDMTLQSASIEYNQEVQGEGIVSGAFTNLSLTKVGGTVELKLLKDAVFETLLTAFTTGQRLTVTLGWGATGSTNNLDIEFTAHCKVKSFKIEEDGILAATITADLMAPTAATSALTITMANTIHRSWPHPA